MKNPKDQYLLLKRRSASGNASIVQRCETKFVSVDEFKATGHSLQRDGWQCAADANGMPVIFDGAALPDVADIVSRVETEEAAERLLAAHLSLRRRTASC